MPLHSREPEPCSRSRAAATLAALLLLLLVGVLSVVACCTLAKEPVVIGPFLVVGPGRDASKIIAYLGGASLPAAWIFGKRAVTAERLGEVGPFLLCRIRSVDPWPTTTRRRSPSR
jgi:hypothetical protein